MQGIPLVKVVNQPLKPITPAAKRRIRKIESFVSEHTLCSFSDIYKNSGATKNREDCKHDVDYLISIGSLIQVLITEKFFKKPIRAEFQGIVSFYQALDDVVELCKKNPHLQESEFAMRIREITPSLNESNIGKILKIYKHEHNFLEDEYEELFSKQWVILIQKGKIFSLEAKSSFKKDSELETRLDNHHDNQIELIRKEKRLFKKEKQASDNNEKKSMKKEKMKIRTEREFKITTHSFDWNRFEQKSRRTDSAVNHFTCFVNFFKLFLENHDLFSKQLYSDLSLASKLTSQLDQIYDDDMEYRSMLRSPRRRSLKELVTVWNYILLGCDENKLAKSHGFKNRKQMLKALEKIQRNSEPNIEKILELQRIERNRILVPETTNEEILSLFNNYDLYNGTEKMVHYFQEKKARKIIEEIKPYSPTM